MTEQNFVITGGAGAIGRVSSAAFSTKAHRA